MPDSDSEHEKITMMTFARARGSVLGFAVAIAVLPLTPKLFSDRVAARPAAVQALLINGGSQPTSNYLSHLQHLQEMVDLLQRRGIPSERIHVFSADGEDPAADLTTRTPPPPDFWLMEDTDLGKRLTPRAQLVDTPWHAVKLHPARLAELRQWFDAARTELIPGDQLMVFVTDHGSAAKNGPGTGTIALWHEQLTVREFRSLLDRLAPGVQVVTVMSQCYSGAFADLMYERGADVPSGNTCGFFATSAEDKAYGCYPEGQDKDRVGYAFEFIEALNRLSTIADAHVQVVRSDSTPDRPRRTSDAYLVRIVSAEATSRKMDRDELVDSLLAAAWRRAATWEPEIRLLDAIGEAFGTFSPRSLRELKLCEKDLGAQADQLKTYSNRWNAALIDAKESVLRAFAAARPEWRSRLDPRALEPLSSDERAVLLTEFLEQLHPFARQSALWPNIERFREAASQGAEASWRYEVRKAAAERMRTILVSTAGRQLLAGPDAPTSSGGQAGLRAAQQQALNALAQCEAMEPGKLSPQAQTTQPTVRTSFPPISDEIGLLQKLQPSWFGIRYGAVPPALRNALPSLSNAPQIQTVEEGSPAADAGLEPGDVILGPADHPFKSPGEVREWTLTSPRDVALPLKVVRPGSDGSKERAFDAVVYLRLYPAGRPENGAPPPLGAPAPALPKTLKSARETALPDVKGRAHLLFFWATWCGPCKASLPEAMAFAAAKGLAVLAVTDEDQATVSKFLAGWTKPFFESVAVDSFRNTFISYGVSGTPTIVMVDADGIVRYRQVGYAVNEGLNIAGWRWSDRPR